MIKLYCDSCGNEVAREPDSFQVVVPTSEGPVTVILSAGYGRPEQNPNFNPQLGGASVCKRCIYLAMQADFDMEEVQNAGTETSPCNGRDGTGR